MGQHWGKALILTTTLLTININYARSLTFGEAVGIGAGALLINRAVQDNRQRYRFVPPEQEFQRGLEDGFNFARYDNPRNSRDYDDGFIEGRRRRESGWSSPNRRS
ncbi:hypothetical protein [Microcystis aeruginosa]|jgi:hypothetical protein|uniref:Uncharacterized protein n=2 Tax=Microcystis aeruginosa TaxID=1126 RepID=A0A552DE22_MICAE|nr:hypothetical protein [Microcystis aeruginosa]TRU20434.1 MAG: hypothetical protein EWV80_17815 [Microcystis aeruginosa Ma_QC_B_20070730_S2]GCE58840.1 hypothetical protein MiAbB_00750 [Microcystis aeruginosa NIES-4285]